MLVNSRPVWHCMSPEEYSRPLGNRVLKNRVLFSAAVTAAGSLWPFGKGLQEVAQSRVSGTFRKPGCSRAECLVSAGENFN